MSDKRAEPIKSSGMSEAKSGSLPHLHRCNSFSNALLESEEMFKGVIEASTDAIIVANADEQVLIWNPGAEKLFGYPEKEVLGKRFSHLIIPEKYRKRRTDAYSRAIHNGSLSHHGEILEAEGIRKDGTLFPLEHTVSMWKVGEEIRFIAILRDISERVRTQKALVSLNKQLEIRVKDRTSELSAANEALNNFAYIISHDLKAPLRSVHQLAQWIVSDYENAFDDEGKHLVQLLLSRVKRMHALIEGVLEYSRIGRVKETSHPVNLNQIWNEVLDMIDIPGHIQTEKKGDLPVILAEPTRIKGILINLLDNAIRFNDKAEGKITISANELKDYWEIHFKDNGIGIAGRYLDKIFNIFQTLSPDKDSESAGIGLTLVKKTVESAGGALYVESEEKKGTTFLIWWPKDEKKDD